MEPLKRERSVIYSRFLDRLMPKKIVFVSSAPQIHYHDYYGINMPCIDEFCVCRATIELIKDKGMYQFMGDTYYNYLIEIMKKAGDIRNCLQDIISVRAKVLKA